MNYTKSFLTYKDQVKLMESRGIQFNGISKLDAEKKLSKINYYKLSGYIKNFQISTDKYDMDFIKVIELYNFDRKLSRIIFEMIEKIEIAFKTNLAYYIGKHIETKGLKAFGYLEIDEWINTMLPKYNSKHKKLMEKLKFKSKITDYTARNVKGCIENYFTKYSDESFVPLWILIEVIDFGMATKMYNDSIKSIQQDISKTLNIVSAKDLEFYLKSLKLIRNTVAHNGILWNFKLVEEIKKPLITQYPDVSVNNLMAVIIIISEILKEVDRDYDYTELRELIRNYFSENIDFLYKFGINNKNINLIDSLI